MTARPQLKLEATGQFLSLPLVGPPHDNRQPNMLAMERCIAALMEVSGH